MDSLTKLSNGELLPFALYLKRGDWDFVPIKFLSTSPHDIEENIYSITEFVKLGMGIHTDNAKVDVKWSIISNSEEKEFVEFSLNTNKAFYLIHKGGAPFIWSIGTYHFEVIFEGKSYYAAFKVTPKSLDIDEIEIMNELIEDKLKGLIVDYLKYKKTLGGLDDIKETAFWYLWENYKNIERSLLNYLILIEKYSAQDIAKRYSIQSVPRKMDRKSLQWETTPKGFINKELKFLNRRVINVDDSEENRSAKYFTEIILKQLKEMSIFLNEFVKNTIQKQELLENLLVDNESRLEEMKGSYNVSEGTIKKYRNKVKHNKDNINELNKQYLKYNKMFLNIADCIKRLESILYNQFWNGISLKKSQRNKLGIHPAYNGIYQIYKNFERCLNEKGQVEIKLPVLKRTEDLYEYFTFFSVIDVFLAQGFKANETGLTEQLKTKFVHEGLADGTTIELLFEQYIVHIVFNEELDFEHEALSRKQMMFTLQPNRKPDIRIDLFVKETEQLNYLSSVVLDAKYSPLQNIYSNRQVTKVMEQLNNYGQIGRFNFEGDKLDSKSPYVRHPIKEVICLYAGEKSDGEENCIISSCGQFIRLAPTKEGSIYGQEDLTYVLFNKWLGQHEEIFLI